MPKSLRKLLEAIQEQIQMGTVGDMELTEDKIQITHMNGEVVEIVVG